MEIDSPRSRTKNFTICEVGVKQYISSRNARPQHPLPETVCSIHNLLFHFSSFGVRRSEVISIFHQQGEATRRTDIGYDHQVQSVLLGFVACVSQIRLVEEYVYSVLYFSEPRANISWFCSCSTVTRGACWVHAATVSPTPTSLRFRGMCGFLVLQTTHIREILKKDRNVRRIPSPSSPDT